MNLSTAHNVFLIHHLRTLLREIPLEGIEQKAVIADMFWHSIPEIIEKIQELEDLKSGKTHTRTSKETSEFPIQLHKSRHTTMHLRTIPD